MDIRKLMKSSVLIDNAVYTIDSIFSYQVRMSFVKLTRVVKTWNAEKNEYIDTVDTLHLTESALANRIENKSAFILTPEEAKKRAGERV